MPRTPFVSVIIPTYNRSRFVLQAVESVLSQTFKNFEIIVVDDGSTDNTREVLQPYVNVVRYVYQENQGVSAARNKGVALSTADYIAFLDSDDLFAPKKLEKQIVALQRCPDAAFAYSNIALCDGNGSFLRVVYGREMFPSGVIAEDVLLRRAMCGFPPTWLIRHSFFDQLGGFDRDFAMSEDRDFSVRAALNYPLVGLPEPLTFVRVHSDIRLGRSRAERREHYYFAFLNKLFTQYGERPDVRNNRDVLIADYHYLAGLNYLREEAINIARSRFWRALVKRPTKIRYFVFWISTLLGRRMFRLANQVRRGTPAWLYSVRTG